jgi:hypothetical protein
MMFRFHRTAAGWACAALFAVAVLQLANHASRGRGEEPPKAKAKAPAGKKLEGSLKGPAPDDPLTIWHKLKVERTPDSKPDKADFDVEITAWYGPGNRLARGPKGVAVPKGPVWSRAVLRVEVFVDETAREQILAKDLKTFALPVGKFAWKEHVSVSLGKIYGKAPQKPQLVVFTLLSTVPVTYHGRDGSERVTPKIFAEERFRVSRREERKEK